MHKNLTEREQSIRLSFQDFIIKNKLDSAVLVFTDKKTNIISLLSGGRITHDSNTDALCKIISGSIGIYDSYISFKNDVKDSR